MPAQCADMAGKSDTFMMGPTHGTEDVEEILDLAMQLSDEYIIKRSAQDLQVYEARMLDLKRSIQLFEQVVSLTPQDDRGLPLTFNCLGDAYLDMFNETGNIRDADSSIENFTKALRSTHEDDPALLIILKHLGKVYHDRYQQSDQATDRDQAIGFWESFTETASARIVNGDISDTNSHFDNEWVYFCGLFGDLYYLRYLDQGEPEDLERSIQLMLQSMHPAAGGQHREGVRMFRLGAVYGTRHQDMGNRDDLTRCIELYEQAKGLLPPDHDDTPGLMKCLSNAYRDRSRMTGSLEDGNLAIQYGEEAVAFKQGSDSNRAGRLAMLGSAWEENDLGMSLRYKQDAVALVSKDDPQRAELLSVLANELALQFSQTRMLADLDQSIQHNTEALALTPEDHPNRAELNSRLGANYHNRFVYHNDIYLGLPDSADLIQHVDMADLEKSIEFKQAALVGTPDEHISRGFRLFSLGEGYEQMYYVTDNDADWDQALDFSAAALACRSSPARDRVRIGLDLISKYALRSHPPRWQEAYEAGLTTFSLVPLLSSLSLETSERLLLLDQAAGLGPDLAAISLRCKKSPFTALQHLEQGRGIVLKSKSELRLLESGLRGTDPGLAAEFARLRAQTEAPPKMAAARYDAGQKLQGMIHGMTGVDLGMPTLSQDELRVAAGHGPIVVINTSPLGCDALLVHPNRVDALELSDLKYSEIEKYARGDRASPQLLAWLWTNLAKPVLDQLDFTETPPDGCWPRVCWIPTGLLSRFPIHAAGLYAQEHGQRDGVLDRVISSYSSSIHALLRALSRPCAPIEQPNGAKAVLVAMEKTPEHGDLKFAAEEVARLDKVCREWGFHVSKPQPTQREVLSALDGCKIFHFAGHGGSNHSQPLQSMLFLEDWKSDPLTVELLCETELLRNQTPFLAYLSACETGKTDHAQDEALHIIGAFQLAGFRHVIGTLWEVDDETCADIAVEIYKWMMTRGLSDLSVSEGLHHAVRGLRQKWIDARGQSRQVEFGTYHDGDIVGQGCQNASRASRPVKPEPRLGKVFWIPLVHFGV